MSSLRTASMVVLVVFSISCSKAPHDRPPQQSGEASAPENITPDATSTGEVDGSVKEQIDPKEVLRQFVAFYRDSQTIQVVVEGQLEFSGPEFGIRDKFAEELMARRPNLVAYRFHGGIPTAGKSIVSNGRLLFSHSKWQDEYTETEAPTSFLKVIEIAQSNLRNLPNFDDVADVPVPLMLIAEDLDERIMKGVTEVVWVDSDQVDGEQVHHLLLKTADRDHHFWIAAQGDPVLHRMVIEEDTSNDPQPQPVEELEGRTVVTYRFKNWKIGQDIPLDQFVFKAPPGVTKAEAPLPTVENEPIPDEATGLKLVWSQKGLFVGATVSPDSRSIIVMQFGSNLEQPIATFDPSSGKHRVVKFRWRRPNDPLNEADEDFVMIERILVAKPLADDWMLLGYSIQDEAMVCIDANGKRKWITELPSSIKSAVAADLDGDGQDEIVVGHSSGISVLDSDGKEIWSNDEIEDVSYVAVGDVLGNDRNEILCVWSGGMIHLFSADGKDQRIIGSRDYAWRIGCAPLNGTDQKDALVIVGSHFNVAGEDHGRIITRTLDKKDTLSVAAFPAQIGVDAFAIAPRKTWAAVAVPSFPADDLFLVFDISNGKLLASVRIGECLSRQVAWLKQRETDAPLLVVSTGNEVRLYEVVGHTASLEDQK